MAATSVTVITATSYAITAVDPADRDALISLFERDGNRCFCRYWHFSGTNKEWEARCGLDAETNQRELIEAIGADTPRSRGPREDGLGLVARIASEPERVVGWMKLAPRRALPKLLARVPYRGLESPTPSSPESSGSPVFSIACFVVDPEHRRRGIARALVEAAIEWAPRVGAAFLEAYPRLSEQPLHDGEAWMGPHAIFTELGFEVVRESPQYPVFRRRL